MVTLVGFSPLAMWLRVKRRGRPRRRGKKTAVRILRFDAEAASASASKFSVADLFQILFLHAEDCRTRRFVRAKLEANMPSKCATERTKLPGLTRFEVSDRSALAWGG